MKWNLKLQPSSLKLTYFYSAQWQNTDTCNTNQLAITTLTNAGSTQSWRPLWATALLLKREVNLPGCPEGSQQWSGSALTSNHPRRRSRNGKKNSGSHNHSSSHWNTSKTPTQKNKIQPSLSSFSLHLSSLPLSSISFRAGEPGVQQSQDQLQNELMFTINKKYWGETAK